MNTFSLGLSEGLCTLFIRHTSASLLIQENYDDSARVDLENWLNRLVPENDSLYSHTLEGADDMPAHIKSAPKGAPIHHGNSPGCGRFTTHLPDGYRG